VSDENQDGKIPQGAFAPLGFHQFTVSLGQATPWPRARWQWRLPINGGPKEDRSDIEALSKNGLLGKRRPGTELQDRPMPRPCGSRQAARLAMGATLSMSAVQEKLTGHATAHADQETPETVNPSINQSINQKGYDEGSN